jgi:CRP/FNR family transcriptional regulator
MTREALGEGEICGSCGSRVAGLCRPLDAASLDDVLAEAEQIHLAPRDMLFREGDRAGHVFTLVQGTAKLTRLLPDRREQVLGLRFAGDVLGFTGASHYPFAAQLLTPARLCRLERRRLDGLLRRYPALERRLLDLCVQELAATQEQLVTVGRRTAEARVAAFLLSLAEAGQRRQHPGAVLDMPMNPCRPRRLPGPHPRNREPHPDRLPPPRLGARARPWAGRIAAARRASRPDRGRRRGLRRRRNR